MNGRILLVLFFAAVTILALAVSQRKGFAVDEVEHVHVAYNISDGRIPYADFWEAHPPALYMLLQPVVRANDAVGSFRRSRGVLFALLMFHLALIGYCGYRMSGRLGGVLAAGFASLHSTMIERAIEVRPDGPMSLLVTGALALELSGRDRVVRYCLQGLLLGMAALFSQKAAIACLAFGCMWLVAAIRNRSPKLVVLPVVAWAVPVAIGAIGLALAGSLDDFWTTTVVASARAAARTEGWMRTFHPTGVVLAEGLRNPVFLAASAWSLVTIGLASRRDSTLVFPFWLGLALVGSLWVNPFPFAYFHITVIPVLSVLVSWAVVESFDRHELPPSARLAFAAVWLALAGMFSVPRLIAKADSELQTYQMATLAEVQRVTGPQDPVFDLTGLYFRPDAHRVFVMTRHMVCRYIAGGFDSIPDALRKAEAAVIVTNYRTEWFFNQAECAQWDANGGRAEDTRVGLRRAAEVRAFIAERYVPYSGNIRVLGTELEPGVRKSLEILKEGEYRFDGTGVVLLNGETFDGGHLSKGLYEAVSDSGGRLLIMTPQPWPKPGSPRKMYVD